MRILILGNNHSGRSFFNLFQKKDENIVFSNIKDHNFIELQDDNDIVDLIEANDINLVLVCDEKFITNNLQKKICELDTTLFCPMESACEISNSKAAALKLMYKNKIKTPRFQIFEKPQAAIDYVKNLQNPVAIKPDEHNFRECTQFFETYSKALEYINFLFKNGNKKIVIQDYVEGKNVSFWALSDGYQGRIIGYSAKYQDNFAYFEPEFISSEMIAYVTQSVLKPTLDALSAQDSEYIGILGMDFILDRNNELNLVGYNSFFDDINVDFFTKGFDVNWMDIFNSTVMGDVFLKYDKIKPEAQYMASIRQKEEIYFISANTKNRLEQYLQELDFDLEEYREAKRLRSF